MPAQRKNARLWLRPTRRDRKRRIIARATYLILDGGKHYPTGCFAGEAERAEQKLAEYIAAKYKTPRKERELEQIFVADVLSIYADDCAPKQEAARRKFDQRIGRLNDFFGGDVLANINGERCRAYAAWRQRGRIATRSRRSALGNQPPCRRRISPLDRARGTAAQRAAP
jgi:hypothetical protein